MLFAILQKYEFSSKSQLKKRRRKEAICCLRYCKSTSFQANHNIFGHRVATAKVVCDTAKVRVFKQITTVTMRAGKTYGCLRYCKSTSFQANHNSIQIDKYQIPVVCDTAKVRVFKQITTDDELINLLPSCLRYCKSTSFQANHNCAYRPPRCRPVVCDTAKVRVFKQITT